MLCCWCIQHEDMRKHEASPALVPVMCKYKMYKPALTATAKQILFVLAAEQIMRQADTQIFSLDGDDFLISDGAGDDGARWRL